MGQTGPMASSQPSTDEAVKAPTADIETPGFDAPAFRVPPPLSKAIGAIVTSASLHHPDDEHLSYAGNQFNLSAIRIDSGPAGARRLSMRREACVPPTTFLEETEAGRTVVAAREAMKDAGVNHAVWFHLAPGDR